MIISIVGMGYVGLTTAIGLASKGHSVVCIDIDSNKVDLIRQKKLPIWEEGLEAVFLHCVNELKSFEATSDYQRILDTDMTQISVGTPSGADGGIDLTNVERSVTKISEVLSKKKAYHTLVIRSTVIPGTTERIIVPLVEKYSGKRVGESIGIAVNPEFMQEGKALQTFLKPDRVIIGEHDRRAGDMVLEISKDFDAPILRTDLTTAEMIKYASNAFLSTKISFINEMGNICQKLGIDVYTVAKGISSDYRIGERFLNAGVGFGGSCLPKDLKALVHSSKVLGYEPRVLESVLGVNEAQPKKMVDLAQQKLGSLANKRVAVLGLAFKPKTDDMRSAPAIPVVNMLLARGALVTAHDPLAMSNARSVLPEGVRYCRSVSEAISGSDCVLILTEWDAYRNEELYRGKTVIDGRRALDPQKARAVCDYQGICW